MSSAAGATGGGETLGGRYRIEAELGRGGMARVCRAVDLHSGQRVALKQLVRAAGGTHGAMFGHEYHTLVQLAHPRIVRAFEFAVDDSGPFYTMELLEGCDVRSLTKRGPRSIQSVCQLLRDAASALSLIHSRGMVHRDVSHRNLWCSPDGRAKLIDLGTLTALGSTPRMAGTPPFVPPEALYGQPLDARCDIFALGALGYYMLTGRNAYPARLMRELRLRWQERPDAPQGSWAAVPAVLSELVMSMLSLDPRGRPASAAEVCERLSAIAALPDDDEPEVAQAFLTSPKLVGREAPARLLRKALAKALHGHCGTASIVAEGGLGRSRMLANAALDAKLMGALVIAEGAGSAGSEPFAVVAAIAERVIELSPGGVALTPETRALLACASPELRVAVGDAEPAELPPHRRSRAIATALVGLFESISRTQPLLIAIDDLHRADSASLSVLARLSLLGEGHHLLVLTSCEASILAHAPPALSELVNEERVELSPLSAEDTHALLGSLFGPIEALERVASWLHDLSLGSPQACMQYARYLVDCGIARHERGHWRLPPDLRKEGMPASVAVIHEGKLASLGPDARQLALGLALSRDDTRGLWQPEHHVELDDFPALLDDGDAGRGSRALGELLQRGLLLQRDDHYVLAQRAMADALMRITPADDRRRMHEKLAVIFEGPRYPGPMRAVRHRQLAGDHDAALSLLVAYAVELGRGMDWGVMRVSVTTGCAKTALEHWGRLGGSPRDGALLRGMLLLLSSAYDWSSAFLCDEQLPQWRLESGADFLDRIDPALEPAERLRRCQALAWDRYRRLDEAERGLQPDEALAALHYTFPLGMGLLNAHDVARLRALSETLSPLRPLSPTLELLSDLAEQALCVACGRDLGDRNLVALARLMTASGLPDVVRLGGIAMRLQLQAAEDARIGNPRALQLMDQLAPAAGEDMFIVLHGRFLGHAFGGNAGSARGFRRRVELTTEDDVWRRKAFLFIEAQLYALGGDLLALERTSEQIAELARTFEGWRPWLLWTRAEVQRLRGELEPAAVVLDEALGMSAPGEHRAWVALALSRAELCLARGELDSALARAREAASAVERLELDPSGMVSARRVEALALSASGEHQLAQSSIASARDRARALGYGGLPLARLELARARIANASGRADEATEALSLASGLLVRADAPALIATHQALAERAGVRSGAAGRSQSPPPEGAQQTMRSGSRNLSAQVRASLQQVQERGERARRALSFLLEDSGARSGHLFLYDGELIVAASLGEGPPDAEHLRLARECLADELARLSDMQVSTSLDTSVEPAATVTLAGSAPVSGGQLTAVLLSDGDNRCPRVAGLALLHREGLATEVLGKTLVHTVSRCLLEAGEGRLVELERR